MTKQDLFERWHHDAEQVDAWTAFEAGFNAMEEISRKRISLLEKVLLERVDDLLSALEQKP